MSFLGRARARWQALAAAHPTPLCWPRACAYYRHRADLERWLGRPGLSHRLYHALVSAPCANAFRPDD